MSATTACRRSVRRAPRKTFAPFEARWRAVASPIPLLAPVMTTTFPWMPDMVPPARGLTAPLAGGAIRPWPPGHQGLAPGRDGRNEWLCRVRNHRARLLGVTIVQLQVGTSLAVLAAWVMFAAVFLFRRRPPPAAERQRDPMGTLGLALQGMGFGLVWGIRRHVGAPFVDASLTILVAISMVTVALAAGSVALTLWSVRTLGRQWALAARLVE